MDANVVSSSLVFVSQAMMNPPVHSFSDRLTGKLPPLSLPVEDKNRRETTGKLHFFRGIIEAQFQQPIVGGNAQFFQNFVGVFLALRPVLFGDVDANRDGDQPFTGMFVMQLGQVLHAIVTGQTADKPTIDDNHFPPVLHDFFSQLLVGNRGNGFCLGLGHRSPALYQPE